MLLTYVHVLQYFYRCVNSYATAYVLLHNCPASYRKGTVLTGVIMLNTIRQRGHENVPAAHTSGSHVIEISSQHDVIAQLHRVRYCTLQAFALMDSNRDGVVDENDLSEMYKQTGESKLIWTKVQSIKKNTINKECKIGIRDYSSNFLALLVTQ